MMLRGFIPAVMIIFIGVMIGKWDSCKHQATLIKLIDNIFLPCLAFSALNKHVFDVAEILSIGLAVLLTTLIMTLLSVLVLRGSFKNCPKNVLRSVYMSSGTLLPPLAFVLFGYAGLAKAIYFHIFISIAYNTLGSLMISGESNLKALFKAPLFYVSILGIITGAFPLSLSESIEEFVWLSEKGISLTAMGALPLLLISFGYPLGLLKLADIKFGIPGGLLRVVAGPVITLLIIFLLRNIGLISMERGYDVLGYLDHRTTEALLLLGAAMPTSHFSMEMVKEEVTAAKTETSPLLASAMLAIVTVPAVLLFILRYIFD